MMPGIALGPARVGARHVSTISGKRWVRSLPGAPFLREMTRKPSCLISCNHWLLEAAYGFVGRHGATNPARWSTCGVWESVAAALAETMAESAHYHIDQHYGSRPCLQQRASPSARGKERRSGVILPICGFQEFHPVGRRKQLRLGCLGASGDELVSLGFRVGNPSAIGGIGGEFSSIPVTHRCCSDNEKKKSPTRSLRRKMARSQAEQVVGVRVFSS
jgi:hypothetical protein